MKPCALVVMAGGKSRRMGADKVLLPFGEDTLVKHVIARYAGCFDPVLLSVAVAGKYGGCGAMQIADLYPEVGPMGGIYSVFAQCDAEQIFITAVDMPFGEARLARWLVENRKGAACVVRRSGGRLEPLFGCYGRECAQAIKQCLDQGKYSIMALFDRVQTDIYDQAELEGLLGQPLDRCFDNLNERQDYREALKRLSFAQKEEI